MVSDDKRTKIGATGPVRAQPVPATSTPAPVAPSPSGTGAPGEDLSKLATTFDPPTSTPMPAVDPSKSYLPPAQQVDPLLGQTLAGRYLIMKKLGEGGMGAVYLATHQLLEKQVALKVLHNEFARKNDLVERFMQEAKAASRIRHENVIDISDFGATPEGVVFFAMELLQGHDLHEEIARARLAGQLLPFERSKKIFLQICAALSAAHGKGIIHRDLKPENIYLVDFLGDPDFVKLLDFGIAKMTEVSEGDRKLTKTGMLFGTPEYMSPEQARGEHVDHRVDVYAMGCIMFQLVTGRVPFEADNFMGVLSLHLTEAPPSIPEGVFDRIGAPRQLAHVIDTALAKDRALRWQTIDDFANAVRIASGEAPVDRSTVNMPAARAASVQAPEHTTKARAPTPPPVTPTPTPVPGDSRVRTQWTGNLQVPEAPEHAPKPKSRVPLIIGAVAIAGVAGVAVFFATRGGKETQPDPVGSASNAPTGPSGSQIAAVTPDAATVEPPLAPVPEWAEIKLDSTPKGAEVTDLSSSQKFKVPKTLRVRGSRTPRQFQFVLKGHSDSIVEIVPDQANIKYTEPMQKGVSGSTPIVKAGSGSARLPIGSAGSATVVKVPDPPVTIDAGVKVTPPPPDECDDPPCIKTNIPGLRDAGTP